MMNKSILIIDTPKKCWDCPLHIESYDDDFVDIMICNAKKLESHYGKIPNYCPLKSLPEKKKEFEEKINHNDDFYEKGWNDCLDEILGEEE